MAAIQSHIGFSIEYDQTCGPISSNWTSDTSGGPVNATYLPYAPKDPDPVDRAARFADREWQRQSWAWTPAMRQFTPAAIRIASPRARLPQLNRPSVARRMKREGRPYWRRGVA